MSYLILIPTLKKVFSLDNRVCTFFTYNHFHNIMRLFDVLQNFPFTTSETIGN